MEDYKNQYNEACMAIEVSISESKKIIICGPEGSGKSYLQKKYIGLLNEKNYDVYYGIEDYLGYHRIHGRVSGFKNDLYWIEVVTKDKSRIADIFDDDFVFIELHLPYPR